MKALKPLFLVCLAVWLGGGLLTAQYASRTKQLEMLISMSETDVLMMNVRSIALNLFGPAAIVLGLILLVRWGLGKLKGSGEEVAPVAAPPPPSSQQTNDGPLRCDFTGWMRDANRIVQDFTYAGGGPGTKLMAEVTVEKGALSTLRFVNFWLRPANGYEGTGELRLVAKNTGKSPGWQPCKLGTAAGNATLINLTDRPGADEVFAMLADGGELELTLRVNGEEVLSLPLPNSEGMRAQYDAVRAGLA